MANDRLQTADAEQLLFKKANPTFHRFSDLSVAVSEWALHWETRRLFGGTRRLSFALPDIQEIVIRPVLLRPPWVRSVACTIWAIFPGLQLIGYLQEGRKGPAALMALVLIAFCRMGWYLVQAVKDRTEIEIVLSRRSVILETPEDDYADEKIFDRKVLRELGDYLRTRGIRVIDQTEDESSLGFSPQPR